MNYKETIVSLFDLQKFGMKFGLDSMNRILGRLGHPERGQKFIHVAGTNGKGSTASMLAGIYAENGYRVGLYTSPHLITFRERIKALGTMISEEEVMSFSSEVWQATDPDSPPTFFEFVTAMAFLYFREKKLDLAIIETGLGGRLDSTNVIDPIICAVTNVSLEHTEYLGKTIEAIASEKAGVIKTGIPFVSGNLCPEALAVMDRRLLETGAPGKIFGRDYQMSIRGTDECARVSFDYQGPVWQWSNISLNLSGAHQAENAALALAVAENTSEKGFSLSEEKVRKALIQVDWPGRAELLGPGQWPRDHTALSPLMLDGAHNPDGARALARLMKNFRHEKLHLVLGVMADKDVSGVLGPIVKQAHNLYLTRPLYSRAASPEMLLEKLTTAFGPPVVPTRLYAELPEAIEAVAREAKALDLVVISGSLFTVGEARAWLSGVDEVESN